MSIRFALFAACAIVFALARPAFADPLADGVAMLPGAVGDVRLGGTWERGERSGVFRIVIARAGAGGEPVTARLFVQWVADQDAGGAPAETTVEIVEFAELGVDIADYTSDSDADGLAVYIRTVDSVAAADRNYELYVFSPTDYRFDVATN
jgi:hypothetical protein